MRKLLSILGIIFISYSLVVAMDDDEYARIRQTILDEIGKYGELQSFDDPYPLNIRGIDRLISLAQRSLEEDEQSIAEYWNSSDEQEKIRKQKSINVIEALGTMFRWGRPKHLVTPELAQSLPDSQYQTAKAMASLHCQFKIVLNTYYTLEFFDDKRDRFQRDLLGVFQVFARKVDYRRKHQNIKKIYDTETTREKIISEDFEPLLQKDLVPIEELCQFIKDGRNYNQLPKPQFRSATEEVSIDNRDKFEDSVSHEPLEDTEPIRKMVSEWLTSSPEWKTLRKSFQKKILPWMWQAEVYMNSFPKGGVEMYNPVLKTVDDFRDIANDLPPRLLAKYHHLDRSLFMRAKFCELKNQERIEFRDINDLLNNHKDSAWQVEVLETMIHLHSVGQSAVRLLEEGTTALFQSPGGYDTLIDDVEKYVANNRKYADVLSLGLEHPNFMLHSHQMFKADSYEIDCGGNDPDYYPFNDCPHCFDNYFRVSNH